jgi:hypothetical protein
MNYTTPLFEITEPSCTGTGGGGGGRGWYYITIEARKEKAKRGKKKWIT